MVLYLHLSQEAVEEYLAGNACSRAVGRFEGVGPLTLEQIRRFLGRTACDVRVQPVINLSEEPAADSYEIPQRLRQMMFLRLPGGMFPWSPGVSRGSDLDHTTPYVDPDHGGPPGQTRIGNLGPGQRTEHRVKTHGGWQFRQPATGVFVCRSRYGNFYLVTDAGTQSLGSGCFAHAVWQAADRQDGG